MKVVYATQFEVRPEGLSTIETVGRLREISYGWIEEWYQKWAKMSIGHLGNAGVWCPKDGHKIVATNSFSNDGQGVWKCVWSYPDFRDGNLIWQLQVVAASSGEKVEFSFVVRLSALELQIRPLDYSLKRPRIIRTVMKDLPCYVGNSRLTAEPVVVKRGDVDDFVKEILLSEERCLPVVVVSKENSTGEYMIKPESFADKLSGLARVYCLEDKATSFAFSNRISKELSCFNGAIRVYWPGMKLRDDKFYHPLYTINRIIYFLTQEVGVQEIIFRKVAGISAIRIVEGSITRGAIAALNEARADEIKATKEKLIAKDTSIETLRSELGKTLEKLDEKDEIILALEKEIEEQKANWYRYQAQISEEYESEKSEEEEQKIPDTVGEAVLLAENSCPNIAILDRAKKIASESTFSRPLEVFKLLIAVSDVTKRYFESLENGTSMGPWEKAFREYGFNYAASDSETTTAKYGESRTITYNGKTIQMGKHITIGGGSREDNLQVYFELDEKEEKMVIGYCGVHLPYVRMRT